jgi:hypothetical protein
MTIRSLLILPPFAIGRLGSAKQPLDNYTIDDNPDQPLGFRRLLGAPTLVVDEQSGEIREQRTGQVSFKQDRDHIRPVAPFLEVFAVTDDGETVVPLDLGLLRSLGPTPIEIEWRVSVANRKVARRTGDPKDAVHADTGWFSDHGPHALRGHSEHFVADKCIEFGHVRFIAANEAFPGIRLRFTPAEGLIYGPAGNPDDKLIPPERAVYDATKGSWAGFGSDEVQNQTVPPSLYAINPPAPSWLNHNVAISRGYLDDTCDGFVEVRLLRDGSEPLTARARICAGPPALVPDSLFVRNLADDLEQVIHGPAVDPSEPYTETRYRAADIVRRAYETVRFMNVTLMNGNNIKGRSALLLDSMPEEEAADTQRAIRPIMSAQAVDTLAILALHEHVYSALRGGAAPWFTQLLRQPDEVADFTDRGRRKMPALMCGADNNYLALTYRQIDTIRKAAEQGLFQTTGMISIRPPATLRPRNLSAQIGYKAAGNPISSRPETSVANCCPGLEVDFRAVWRRMFKGIVLREYDNLVVELDPGLTDPQKLAVRGQRLLRVRLPDSGRAVLMMTTIRGPAASDPDAEITLSTQFNPNGLAALEWSNALAHVLHESQGKTVTCDFTKNLTTDQAELQQPWNDDPDTYVSVEFEVRSFFEEGSAVISRALADAGELTQGLCSPWQNDYRECSCYYWASARPDYINVEPAGNGLSKGDNWLQKERTGNYVPDDYVDSRLILYDELFEQWERWLRFQIGGRDAPEDSPAQKHPATEAPRSAGTASGSDGGGD